MSSSLRFGVVASLLSIFISFSGPSYATTWVQTQSHALPLKPSVAAAAAPADMPMHITVSLKLQNQAQLKSFLANQRKPGSPQYGVKLTPTEFAAAYGPTSDQAQAVVDYLYNRGFTHITVAPNRVLVNADGNVGLVQRAFNTRIAQFQFEGKTVHVPVKDIMVPDYLGNTVLGVLGVQNAVKWYTNSSVKPSSKSLISGTNAGNLRCPLASRRINSVRLMTLAQRLPVRTPPLR